MSWQLFKDLILETVKNKKVLATDTNGTVVSGEGVDGTFTTTDSKTVTVTKGIITNIV